MGYTITIGIQKGGTGKTTTAAILAQAVIFSEFKALAIDLDPQGNLSFILGADTNRAGAYEFLNGAGAAETIQTTAQGMDVLAASWNLSTVTTSRGSARRLQAALEPIKKNYDLIIIDTPPTTGELQYNALQASDGLVIPMHADILNLQSLYQITDAAQQIQQSNPGLHILGYVLTQFAPRSIIVRRMAEAIDEKAKSMGIPFLGAIHRAAAVQEASALQVSIFEYSKRCKAADDYLNLYNAIIYQLYKESGEI